MNDTAKKVLIVMLIATKQGQPLQLRDAIRQQVGAAYPGTGGIFEALEDLERDGKVGRDYRGFYHLIGVVHV